MEPLIDRLKGKIIKALKLSDVSPEDIDIDAPLIGGPLGIDSIDTLELLVLLGKRIPRYRTRCQHRPESIRLRPVARGLYRKEPSSKIGTSQALMAHVPVIGIGAISSLGNNVRQGFNAILEAQDGISPLYLFDSGLKTPPLCAQVCTIPVSDNAPNRTASLALCAARESLAHIEKRQSLSLAIVVATTVAGMTRSERFYEQLRQDPGHIENAGRELHFTNRPRCRAFYAAL